MRIRTAIVPVALTGFLAACDQQQPVSDVDASLGFDCFDSHRASQPPGTQYEGIEKLAGNRLTIRIMNGVDVVTLDCTLSPDGTIQPTGQ